MRKKLTAVIVALITLVLVAGCDKKQKVEEKPKAESKIDKKTVVGFIYIGPVGDGGWTYSHDQGRKFMEEKLKVKTLYKESVPESPEVKDIARAMIEQGANVIFATSFGFMKYVKELSEEFPDVMFMHCSGYETTENMGNYFGRMEEPRFLSGIVAGMKSKTNKIGYVAAYSIPEVVRGINAFTLGVKSVNPNANVYVRWTHTWYDPAKEKEAAKSLLDEGADVIAQHQDTAGPMQAAEERGAWAIGYHSDMKSKAPKAYITAPIWNWGPYYVKVVESIINESWKSDSYYGGMKDGVVELAPLTENAPEGAAVKIAEVEAKIKSGSFNVFQGPIKDQAGIVKIEEGKIMEDKDILSFNWFVEGVNGKIESK